MNHDDVSRLLSAFAEANRELLSEDPEFREWLATEYVPIAGGWQY
jgi:hypothetical protein